MGPQINPPWESNPLQELDPTLRPAVEAVRKEAAPPESLERSLKWAEELPATVPPRRPWVPRRVWTPVLAVAASLLLITGVCALFALIPMGGDEAGRRSQIWLGMADKSESLTDEQRDAMLTFADLKAEDQQSLSDARVRARLEVYHHLMNQARADLAYKQATDKDILVMKAGRDKLDLRTPLMPPLLQKPPPQDQPPVQKPEPPRPPQGGQQGGEGPQTETYSHFVDNPFLAAERNPLSTFATTVDTASYSNVRRFLLQEKRLPPPDAVRVAELINYFPYTYPAPTGEHPLAVALDMVECPWNRQHHLLRVGLKGRELSSGELPPRNFVFLIDTSGSMAAENRLPLLKKSLAMLVEQLTPQDRVAMVAYAGSAGLVLPSTPGNEKDKILAALDRLGAGGSTNGGEGIVLAYKVAEENMIRQGLNRVILGTDGDFNVGVTSEGDLVRLIEQKKKGGVFLSILGYGMGNVKDATMERLAYHGNGHYAYIDSETEETRKVFVEQGASLVAIAKDVKLQLEFNPLRVAGYRLIGYENRLLRAEDFNDDTKHGGSVGAGHTVTALYEIVPAGVALPPLTGEARPVDPLKYQKPAQPSERAANGDWVTAKLRYKDPETDSSKLLELPLAAGVIRLADAGEDVRFAASVAGFGMLLRKSEHRGSLDHALVRELAAKALGKDSGGHRAGFLEMVDAAAALGR